MSERPIGYYVHHHGAGHRARAQAIAKAAGGRLILVGTGIQSPGINLADDRVESGEFDGVDRTRGRPEALHYAPLDHAGIRSRVATIARWIETFRPSLMVVDVSVEIAMLARLASVPVVYVRLNGDRNDNAHLDAFKGAAALLAPFHEDLEATSTLPWVRQKSRYLPGIVIGSPAGPESAEPTILVVFGRGGEAGEGDKVARAAAHCPQWRWRVIGPCSVPHLQPPNLDILGWVQNSGREIANATLVVGAAGDGLVGGILAADRPFICIPENRAFNEQRATAHRLGALGAALVLSQWPDPARWPKVIDEVLALPAAARRGLHDPGGADAAASWICQMADTTHRTWDQAA